LIFTRGIPGFSNENENEAIGIFWVFPKIFSSCIGPMNNVIYNIITASIKTQRGGNPGYEGGKNLARG